MDNFIFYTPTIYIKIYGAVNPASDLAPVLDLKTNSLRESWGIFGKQLSTTSLHSGSSSRADCNVRQPLQNKLGTTAVTDLCRVSNAMLGLSAFDYTCAKVCKTLAFKWVGAACSTWNCCCH